MSARRKIILIFLLSFLYAFIRYVYFGPYHFPGDFFFILNKSFALSSAILLFLIIRSGKNCERKQWGKTVFVFVSLHVLLSVILFFKGYFDHSFRENPYLFWLNVLVGATAYFFLYRIFTGIKKMRIVPASIAYWKQLGWVVIFILIHTILWGAKSWLHPEKWYGSLVPITLVAFGTLSVALILLRNRRRKNVSRQ